jgi:3-hydroxy-3-methylglutaryl CoA synthase
MKASATPLGSVLSVGAHVPRLRLPRAAIAEAMAWANPPSRAAVRGSRAVANWDEDALTMGVEAARCCRVPSPQSLYFCSTTSPFADRNEAVFLGAALGFPEELQTLNLGSSLRAGTNGLIAAARRADTSTLVVASDARLTRAGSPQELSYGDGAAAVLLGPSNPAALASIVATRSIGSDFVDHYRMNGKDFDYALEERWVRDESLMKRVPEVIAQLLLDAGVGADSVKHFAIPASASTAARIAAACGLAGARRDASVLAECGDAGAALPLLLLIAALEAAQPGDWILAVGIGQGVDALLLRAQSGAGAAEPALARSLQHRHEETSYVRYLSHRGLLDVDFGMRAERDQRTAHSVSYRKRDALNAFVGGRCARCGTVQFPRSRICVNPDCRVTDAQEPYGLADSRGRVKTFTEDWQAYAARPPYVYGNIEFAEGGNLLMEVTDIDAGELKVNDAVRFVFRIKDEDRPRGFRRYFWKAAKA